MIAAALITGLIVIEITTLYPRTDDALAAYGLATVTAECEDVSTNLGGPYRFCPLMRKPKS